MLRRSGVQIAALFVVLLIASLGFVQIYITHKTEDIVFSTKETALENQTGAISTSLSQLDELTEDSVRQVMDFLDDSSFTGTVITDAGGMILYDGLEFSGDEKRYALYPELIKALSGYDVIHIQKTDGVFVSAACSPIIIRNVTVGAVYIFDYDTETSSLTRGVSESIAVISAVVGAIFILVGVIVAISLSKKYNLMLNAIARVGNGEYDKKLVLKNSGELSVLAEEFNILTERLDETEKARRRFVSDASHELKTPLASIQLLSDSVTQSNDMPTELMREFVTDIGSEAQRLGRITEKLLSLSRIDGDKNAPVGAVDFTAVVRNAERVLMPIAAEKNISVSTALENEIFIISNEDELTQVVLNLCENAVKYNVPDGSINVLLYRKDGKAVFIVDDTGIGIPAEDLPHIFERFYRVDKARSREAGGSGLGLSIVMEIVSKYNGSISASGRQPRGTRFMVTFPLIADDSN